jgi:hypothetical protein
MAVDFHHIHAAPAKYLEPQVEGNWLDLGQSAISRVQDVILAYRCGSRDQDSRQALFVSREFGESNWPSKTSMRFFLADKTQCILLYKGSSGS